jgi:hypothetical protein
MGQGYMTCGRSQKKPLEMEHSVCPVEMKVGPQIQQKGAPIISVTVIFSPPEVNNDCIRLIPTGSFVTPARNK